MSRFEAVVIGASAGGAEALSLVFERLPIGFPLPIIVVQHITPTFTGKLFDYMGGRCALIIKEATELEEITSGVIYYAPPDYHLLVEEDKTFALSIDEKVNYSRPSIDVLFESAASVYGPKLIGVILTGSNPDGALGLKAIKEAGGEVLVEDPETASSPEMPKAALKAVDADHIVDADMIAAILTKLSAYSTEIDKE